jgi:hypothetical protein
VQSAGTRRLLRDLLGRDGTVIAQWRLTGRPHAIGGAVPI